MMGTGTALLLSLALVAWPVPTVGSAALEEGNRRFARDEVEAALGAYAAGWSGDGSPLDGALAYNAGTCAERLGRLPEALLWYRRAAAATPQDSWVQDNLASTRQALGSPPQPEGARDAWETWVGGGRRLQAAGVALAWAALALLALVKRPSRRVLALLGLLACAAFAAGEVLAHRGHRGHRAAVLLAACPGGPPAGSEVWVKPAGNGWEIAGRRGSRCPEGTVGLVEP
jgi:tetratricopeptide (TPR) repeat protein